MDAKVWGILITFMLLNERLFMSVYIDLVHELLFEFTLDQSRL